MAVNSLICADVPVRNCSLTHSHSGQSHLKRAPRYSQCFTSLPQRHVLFLCSCSCSNHCTISSHTMLPSFAARFCGPLCLRLQFFFCFCFRHNSAITRSSISIFELCSVISVILWHLRCGTDMDTVVPSWTDSASLFTPEFFRR